MCVGGGNLSAWRDCPKRGKAGAQPPSLGQKRDGRTRSRRTFRIWRPLLTTWAEARSRALTQHQTGRYALEQITFEAGSGRREREPNVCAAKGARGLTPPTGSRPSPAHPNRFPQPTPAGSFWRRAHAKTLAPQLGSSRAGSPNCGPGERHSWAATKSLARSHFFLGGCACQSIC